MVVNSMGELIFIGLGLWNSKDITLAGLEAARQCDICFAEFYTSSLGVEIDEIEKVIKKPLVVLSRDEVENGDSILNEAMSHRVCLLAGGDPMTATTHIDLRLRAIEMGIHTRVIHGISIVTAAAGLLGLQSYKFGRATTLVAPQGEYFPLSPYEVIRDNLDRGMHTLVLLDIQDKSFMTVSQAVSILKEMERRLGKGVITKSTLLAAVARASSPSPSVKAGYPQFLQDTDMGSPLHTIVVPGDLHVMEAKALRQLADAPADILKN